MKFIEITDMDAKRYKEKHGLTLLWAMAVNPFKIKYKNKIVGLIDISIGMYGDKSVQIDNFEIFDKGKGIGSKVIDAIIKEFCGQDIYAYAYDEKSRQFWEMKDFVVVDDNTGTPIHCHKAK